MISPTVLPLQARCHSFFSGTERTILWTVETHMNNTSKWGWKSAWCPCSPPSGQAASGDGDGTFTSDPLQGYRQQRWRGGGDQAVLQQEGMWTCSYSSAHGLLVGLRAPCLYAHILPNGSITYDILAIERSIQQKQTVPPKMNGLQVNKVQNVF